MQRLIAMVVVAGVCLLLAGASGCARGGGAGGGPALSFDELRGQDVRYRLFQRHQSSNYWDDGKTIPQRTGERILDALEGARQQTLEAAPGETTPPPFIAKLEAAGSRGGSVHVVFCEGLRLVEYRFNQYTVPADQREELGELLRSAQDRGRRPIR